MLKRNPCLKHWRMLLKIWKNIGRLLHTCILIFGIAIPYLRPIKATNWNFLVPRWLFATCWNTQSSTLLLSLLPNTTFGREESPNMWHTYLGQVIIFFWRLMRVIIKIEVREITFGHAVIIWNFFLIFYCCKIATTVIPTNV